MFSKSFRSVLILFFISCSGGIFAQNAAPDKAAVPRFETSECAVPIPQTETKYECGYLIVRENRKANNDKTIRLPVVILKSENPKPKPDPVLRTFGGPGASTMNLVRGRRFSPWLKDRDMIIFEQRGTRYAQPALVCPEVNDTNIAAAKKNIDKKSARQAEIQAAKACYDRLKKQGIDLSAYNSAESAADIEDLRRVLKLEKLNLYGLSYSARLMLNVMRDYPQGVRSVVLESTLTPEVNYDEEGVDGIVYALGRLFENCKADVECAKTFPNLENEFYAAVARLNQQPYKAELTNEKTGGKTEIYLDGNDFATWVVDYMLSNDPPSIAAAPFIIHQVFEGKYAAFGRYASEKVSPSSYALGMRYSVWCGEEMPFENRRRINAQSTKYPNLRGYEVMSLPDICSVWKVGKAKPVENAPVESPIPAMVIAAEYDAYTPPAWSRRAAKNLKNSFYFEVPWAGHGPAFNTPCLTEMIAAFFDKPNAAPDPECLVRVKEQFKFVTKPPPAK